MPPHRIDDTLGSDLGLADKRYADTPAFQIINDTHDLFFTLTSRLVYLEYGPNGDQNRASVDWPDVQEEMQSLAKRLSTLGGYVKEAAKLADDIRDFDERLVTADVDLADIDPQGHLGITREQANAIFETYIAPTIGSDGSAPESRAFIVVAGQHGSGKSTAIRQAELGLQGATQKIIGEDLLAWVPGYYAYAKANPSVAVEGASALTQDLGREIVTRAAEMKANFVLEVTDPTHSRDHSKWARASNYSTELHVVATPSYLSWTSMFDRAERALENGHIGTNMVVSKAEHDRAYAGWPRAVFDAEQQKLYDRVVIKRRDGTIIYENELRLDERGTNYWKQPPEGLEKLLEERHRAVSEKDAKFVRDTWDRVAASPQMQSDDQLASLPLRDYRNQVVSYVESEASRLLDPSTTPPVEVSAEPLHQWYKSIKRDVSATGAQLFSFSHSEDYPKRMAAYQSKLEKFYKACERLSAARAENMTRSTLSDQSGPSGPSRSAAKRQADTPLSERSHKRSKRVTGGASQLDSEPSHLRRANARTNARHEEFEFPELALSEIDWEELERTVANTETRSAVNRVSGSPQTMRPAGAELGADPNPRNSAGAQIEASEDEVEFPPLDLSESDWEDIERAARDTEAWPAVNQVLANPPSIRAGGAELDVYADPPSFTEMRPEAPAEEIEFWPLELTESDLEELESPATEAQAGSVDAEARRDMMSNRRDRDRGGSPRDR